jgi:fructose-1,6-bisphosphatase/inositol monophosphatase family enzyme
MTLKGANREGVNVSSRKSNSRGNSKLNGTKVAQSSEPGVRWSQIGGESVPLRNTFALEQISRANVTLLRATAITLRDYAAGRRVCFVTALARASDIASGI